MAKCSQGEKKPKTIDSFWKLTVKLTDNPPETPPPNKRKHSEAIETESASKIAKIAAEDDQPIALEGLTTQHSDDDKLDVIIASGDESDLLDQSLANTSLENSSTKADHSELDASMIFGTLCSPIPTDSAKKRVKRNPTSGKKTEVAEKRKEEKLRLRAEREKQLNDEREAKRLEKEQSRLLKEKQKQDEKRKKQEEIDEKSRIKEEERKKRQEELDAKNQMKEMEKQKKLQLISAKNEEKKRKDEERLKKIEEKKKLEEEEERKKLKVKQTFANFFTKNRQNVPESAESSPSLAKGLFKPFQVKKGMTVASVVPSVSSELFHRDSFEEAFKTQDHTELYLTELKTQKHKPLKRPKNKKKPEEDDVIVLEDDSKKVFHQRGKLFQFTENVRPPYWGTWTKQSSVVKSRNPFAQDKMFFDYEVDSEEEWEEEEPGESLSGTEEEKESEDDYEVDNEFFVPHGYLSADEDKDEEKMVNPEENQARLKMREIEFNEDRKKKYSELKPRMIGCLWTMEPAVHQEELLQHLNTFRAVVLTSVPIQVASEMLNEDAENTTQDGDKLVTESKISKPRAVPKEALLHLIRLVHANSRSKQILMKEFQEFWKQHSAKSVAEIVSDSKLENTAIESSPPSSNTNLSPKCSTNISKRQLEITISKMATWNRTQQPNCWWVNEDVLKEHNCHDLPVPNQWTYVSQIDTPKQAKIAENSPADPTERTPKKPACNTPSILKFAKKLSDKTNFLVPEDNKLISESPKNIPSSTNTSLPVLTPPSTPKIAESKINKNVHGTPSILKFITKKRITPITLPKENPGELNKEAQSSFPKQPDIVCID